MTVKDYADELKMSVKALIAKCKELDINVSDGEDILEDDDTETVISNQILKQKVADYAVTYFLYFPIVVYLFLYYNI